MNILIQIRRLIVCCMWMVFGVNERLILGSHEIRSSSTKSSFNTWKTQRNFLRRHYLKRNLHIDSSSSSSEELHRKIQSYSVRKHSISKNTNHRKRNYIKNREPMPVLSGRSYINVCLPNPCKNDGVCFNINTFTCFCRSSYFGKLCQRKDVCSSNPCRHGGKCKQFGNTYRCHCHAHYTGINCQIKDLCEPNVCHNEAKCIASRGSFHCRCQEGYIGKHCETFDHPCLPNPCSNSGYCSYSGLSYSCECTRPYTGQLCEVIADFQMFKAYDPCNGLHCLHNGVCTAKEGGINCRCYPTYQGDVCELPADFPAMIGPKLTDLFFWSGIDAELLLSNSTFFAPIDSVLLDIHADFSSNQVSNKSSFIAEFIRWHTIPGYNEDGLESNGKIGIPTSAQTSVIKKLKQIQIALQNVCGRIIDNDNYKGKKSIFIVDKVLITPTIQLEDILSTDDRFAQYYKHVKHLPRIISILKNADLDNTVTLLVPTNSAMDALDTTLKTDTRAFTWIFFYHVIIGHVCFPHSTADDTYVEIELFTETQDTVLFQSINGKKCVNDVSVIESDIVTQNGIIHVIGNVLEPP